MMQMTLFTLMILQLNTVMMGHGKLKRKQSKELLTLRKMKSNNEDYDMFAEYTPLRISTNAPRFKIIDNQHHTIEPSAGTLKWKKKRHHKSRPKATTQTTTDTNLQGRQSKKWHLEPSVTKSLANVSDQNYWRLDSRDYEATRIPGKPESVENNSELTDEPETVESVDDTTTWNENLNTQNTLSTFGAEVLKDTTIRKKEYIHTWRTFEPVEESSVSVKPEYQNIGRLDSDDAETSKTTDDSDSLRFDSDESDISEATETSKKNTDEATMATSQAEASEDASKQTDYNTWRTWKHYTSRNSDRTATKVKENIESTDKATGDSAEKADEENNREGQIEASEPTKNPYEKLGVRHLRIGSDESKFNDK